MGEGYIRDTSLVMYERFPLPSSLYLIKRKRIVDAVPLFPLLSPFLLKYRHLFRVSADEFHNRQRFIGLASPEVKLTLANSVYKFDG